MQGLTIGMDAFVVFVKHGMDLALVYPGDVCSPENLPE